MGGMEMGRGEPEGDGTMRKNVGNSKEGEGETNQGGERWRAIDEARRLGRVGAVVDGDRRSG
jgi:hypothetical protein